MQVVVIAHNYWGKKIKAEIIAYFCLSFECFIYQDLAYSKTIGRHLQQLEHQRRLYLLGHHY